MLEGDPTKPGPFVMRIKVPDGYRLPPHTHPKPERVVTYRSFRGRHGEPSHGDIRSLLLRAAIERPANSADEPKAALRNRLEPRCLPLPVYGPENGKELPPNGRVRLKRKPSQFHLKPARSSTGRKIQEVGFCPLVLFLINPDVRVPAPVTYRVPAKADGHPPGVTDGSRLFHKERVFPVGGEENEKVSVPEILDVRESGLLSPRSCPLGKVDSVPCDELPVYALRILPFRNLSRYVKPVAVSEVGDG